MGADPIDVVIDVDAIGDGAFVAVLLDEVLLEEAEGLHVRSGGKADEIGIKIFEDLAPEVVDGAVAFVGDDEIERLDGQTRIVSDRERIFEEGGDSFAGGFIEFGIDFLAAQHGVETLNSGDSDAADGVELVPAHLLDVVKLGEFAAIIWRDELLELFQSLVAEISAIDQEQNSAGSGVFDEPIDEVDSGEGFATAGRHLDESAEFVRTE